MNTRTALRSISAITLAGMTAVGLAACSDSDADNNDAKTTAVVTSTVAPSDTETGVSSDGVADKWLSGGEPLTVDIPLLKRGEVTPEVVMDSLTIDNPRVETSGYSTDVCYDVSAHYKVTQKSEAGTGFDTENPELEATAKYAAASVYQDVSLGFDKDPEHPLGFVAQFVYRNSSDADALAAFDLDKNTFSMTSCVHADMVDDFSKMTAHASLSGIGANNNTSTEDKDVIGWELGSPKTA